MSSSTSRKAENHFGAISRLSREIRLTFGAIGSSGGNGSVIFVSVRRLTGS
jgi:hypothetical protein